ncbi:hypothetical protein B0H15DRAFT_1027709 [Mycena belliarum]|uniref:Uncharacterized protein n=1 Tax=Mycena belliarum TaxID=1033014 RepID=A0AAD6TS24_9AGAR|nr:hypothetical protein B0H15DRAFT_1027709 [Mycena belliae]
MSIRNKRPPHLGPATVLRAPIPVLAARTHRADGAAHAGSPANPRVDVRARLRAAATSPLQSRKLKPNTALHHSKRASPAAWLEPQLARSPGTRFTTSHLSSRNAAPTPPWPNQAQPSASSPRRPCCPQRQRTRRTTAPVLASRRPCSHPNNEPTPSPTSPPSQTPIRIDARRRRQLPRALPCANAAPHRARVRSRMPPPSPTPLIPPHRLNEPLRKRTRRPVPRKMHPRRVARAPVSS